MLKPFHESVIDFINDTSADDKPGLTRLAVLLMGTVIPKNHEAIAAAWTNKARQHGAGEQREKDPLPNEFLEQKWFQEVNDSIMGQKPG